MVRRYWLALLTIGLAACEWGPSRAAAQALVPGVGPVTSALTPPVPALATPPAPAAGDRPLAINLATALQLANARPLDIALASERVRVAAAQLERANVLWLPTIFMGVDYFRHDGQIQSVEGNIFGTSRSAFMVGAGPYAVFGVTDAIFEPLAARQVLRAHDAAVQTTKNDTLLAVAESYFFVQQARGDLAAVQDVVQRVEELLRRVEKLAEGLVPPLETVRVKTELSRRRLAVHSARERWRLASADLARVLRLDPAALVEPMEPPHLKVTLVDVGRPLDELIALALTSRPELAGQQALVQATLYRLRQERMRPLIPSLVLRGASTNPAGTLSGGLFGGGRNDDLSRFSARSDFDIQVLWELQNFGLGNRARVNRAAAENELSALDFLRVQDRVAAEVAQAHAQARSAADRLVDAETAVKEAADSVTKNFEGLQQTRRVGDVNLLVVRPQEAIAAIQALAQAYLDYYTAIADFDRAQFRLYRALGAPAEALAGGAGELLLDCNPRRAVLGMPVAAP